MVTSISAGGSSQTKIVLENAVWLWENSRKAVLALSRGEQTPDEPAQAAQEPRAATSKGVISADIINLFGQTMLPFTWSDGLGQAGVLEDVRRVFTKAGYEVEDFA